METLDRHEIEILGQYNAEVSRGIMHTKKWKAKMAKLQKIFNNQYKLRRK